MTSVSNQAQKRCSTLQSPPSMLLVFHVSGVPCRSEYSIPHHVLGSPLSTAFSTDQVGDNKARSHTNPAASVHKAIVQCDGIVCSFRCSYRTVCIPKHIPCSERSSRLRRHMSILKVRVYRAPRRVNLCRSPSPLPSRSSRRACSAQVKGWPKFMRRKP
jgi:hypothetical protein